MDSVVIMKILQIFLTVFGAIIAIWGIYDMYGDGQQNSTGIKKILGGASGAAIAFFLMQWAIQQVQTAQSMAGIK
ncbi:MULTISPECIES: hypothetical protein [Caproicibacterium]|uniref:Uncharacterized protein n=2 Tax=Caproicibacterium TaxID=2834348 RepID=A0A7G9WJN1_9FIRM|nr:MULTISPECIES: hypothetical protein [Caproicibacterium]QNO18893.1 hypothetical protein H6X83_04490 [Caproicibacterium amylolyticum]WOC32888.1 hypothetical protein PXC00_03150 [Caproicibacterium argilliputei]